MSQTVKYYQMDKSGLIFKCDQGLCSYLNRDGGWTRHQPLFGKLVGGDCNYETISEEKVNRIIAELLAAKAAAGGEEANAEDKAEESTA